MSQSTKQFPKTEAPSILLTGATGYVGGRLLKCLVSKGHRVRCLVRRPESIRSRYGNRVDLVQGDLICSDSVATAFHDIKCAYYLVHSMSGSRNFVENERTCAQRFAEAAREAGVERIVYLGGILDDQISLSDHLSTRKEVGDILRERSGAVVLEFRASIIIGSGSISFELVRSLVEKLPIMITPKWVSTKAQPISIRNVLSYLVQALDHDVDKSATYEIGGSDQVSYLDIMKEYARQRGLRRIMLPVPVITPYLSSLWLGLVTPIYARIGRHLIESIRHPTIVKDEAARHLFNIQPMTLKEAIAEAIHAEDKEIVETKWSDAVSSSGNSSKVDSLRFGRRIIDCRQIQSGLPINDVFGPIRLIGGKRGWYYANWIWRLRGLIDLIFGGVGLRRGRRDAHDLHVGDTLDWWRVEAFENNKHLLLAAEMKLPGRAWLEFAVERKGEATILTQTAIFDPRGILGLLYWYGLYPIHRIIFCGMLQGIMKKAGQETIGACPA